MFALRTQHSLQNAVYREGCLAKTPDLYAHLTYKHTRRSWGAHTKLCRAFSEWAGQRTL